LSTASYLIGIDLGGTAIKAALFDRDLRSIDDVEAHTPAREGPDAVIGAMAGAVTSLLKAAKVSKDDVSGLGLGSPGPLDLDTGCTLDLPNFPGFANVPIRDRLAEAVGLPVVIENDANAAALGEFVCGSGEAVSMIVLLTLGTGVGSGIVQDGRVFHGAHGIAPELGHMIVAPEGAPCECGQRGCLEQYASATALVRHARRLIDREDPDSRLRRGLEERGELTAKSIGEAYRGGDPLAREAWDRLANYLAIGCTNIARICDPDLIVLGGGLAGAGDKLIDPVRERFFDIHWTLTDRKTDIVAATLGNRAGIIGAASLARERFL
jgi:glucokinase